MLNAFSRDIRSVRAQENIGVHLGAPLLVEHFPEKSDPYLSSNRRRPSTADLEAHSWINERLVVADSVEKVFLGWRPKFSRTTDAFHVRRYEGPHRFTQKRPWTFVAPLQSLAAARTSK